MVDLIVRGRVDRHNVMMHRSDFRCEFLNHSNWSCYKKYTNNPRSLADDAGGGENPARASSEEEETFNPNKYIGTNKYLVNCVY